MKQKKKEKIKKVYKPNKDTISINLEETIWICGRAYKKDPDLPLLEHSRELEDPNDTEI